MGGTLNPKEIEAKALDRRVTVKRLSDWKQQLKQAQFVILAEGQSQRCSPLKKKVMMQRTATPSERR
jgi:hypothetical protein